MAKEAKPRKETAINDDWLHHCAKGTPEIKVQQRILEKVNEAQRAQDIAESLRVEIDVATKILHTRDAHSPFGFHEFRHFWDPIPELVRELILHWFRHRIVGHWNEPIDIPDAFAEHEAPVHAALFKNGHVLFIPHGHNFTGLAETYLWNPLDANPLTAFYSPETQPTENLYCSGHAFLSDGVLFTAGGGGASPSGMNRAWLFDRDQGTGPDPKGKWTQVQQPMGKARWYPTVLSLGGGRVLIVGGRPCDASAEMFYENTSPPNQFKTVCLSNPVDFNQTYPGLHLLPNGQVFNTPTGFGNAGTGNWTGTMPTEGRLLSVSGTTPPSGSWAGLGTGVTMDSANRVKGMSAPFFLCPMAGSYITKVLVACGSGTNTAEVVDFSSGTPSWTSTPALPGPGRNNVNLVLLPNSTAFLCGGGTPAGAAVKECAIYDPLSNTWLPMDSLTYRRAYHSVALLLPSGQVMVTGDEDSFSIEIFNPPYLYAPGTRPVIDCAPDVIHHGQTFEVISPQAADDDRVVLVRPMAVTHQTDTEQRVIGMNVSRSGSTLTVIAPNGNHPHPLAPRGYYMLFLVNGQGVPSVAKFVWLH